MSSTLLLNGFAMVNSIRRLLTQGVIVLFVSENIAHPFSSIVAFVYKPMRIIINISLQPCTAM